MLKNTVKSGTFNPLNDQEKDYIRKNYSNTPVLKMSQHLKRDIGAVYKFMTEEGLESFNSRRDGQRRPAPEKHKPGCFYVNPKERLI